MILRASTMLLPLLAATLVAQVIGQNISDDQMNAVKARLADGATHPWELGTRAQALLEWDVPALSVFSMENIPPSTTAPDGLSDFFQIAQGVVAQRGKSNGNITGPQALVNDDSAADPASIGVAVLLANWTGQGAKDGLDYAGAAKDQLDFLYQKVPKTSDGAISHRTQYLQLWSDFVYMVPPFLAYYGVLSENRTLLLEGYNQASLYRKYLRDSSAGNMWKHVIDGPSANDDGHWTTGNGWAAAGMLRVLATIQRSQYANSLKHQQEDLANWVQEIHDGIYPHLDQTNIFRNYPDRDLSTAPNATNFYDSSGTAILASTVYRLSALWGVHKHLPFAERSRLTLLANANSTNTAGAAATGNQRRDTHGRFMGRQESTSSHESSFSHASSTSTSVHSTATSMQSTATSAQSTATSPSSTRSSTATSPTATSSPTSFPDPQLAHFSSQGWLQPVVNPDSYGSQGKESPEGQAFVLEMQAAWRDWVAAGSPGANGAAAVRARSAWTLAVCAASLGAFLL